MIWDMQSLFSWDQAITATANSTNVIDLGAVGTPVGGVAPLRRDLGAGGPVPLRIQVTQTFATLTSLTVALQTSDDEAFGSGVVTLATTGAVLAAALVAGATLAPQYMPDGTYKRYLRMVYTVAGTNASAGKLSSGLVTGHQTNR